jgi:hypothetical protein
MRCRPREPLTFIAPLCGLRAIDLEFLCRSFDIGGEPRIPLIFGSAMKDDCRNQPANPYSPLMCGLLLLIMFAAIEVQAVF